MATQLLLCIAQLDYSPHGDQFKRYLAVTMRSVRNFSFGDISRVLRAFRCAKTNGL